MFWFYFGVYTLFVAIVWGFFIVIRVHALRFKNFQTKIQKILRVISVVLFVLTILGYISLYTINTGKDTSVIKELKDIDESNVKKALDTIDTNYY